MTSTNTNPNRPSSATQCSRILRYLQNGHFIDDQIARSKFLCSRLAARIHDLKNKGYVIDSEFITLPSGKKAKRYFLAS